MKRSIFAVLLIAVMLSIPVSAKETWVEVRSKNFHLISNASEKNVRQIAITLEQFREAISMLFPNASISSPVPMRVIIFKDKKSYSPHWPVYQGKLKEVAGYFMPGTDVNYITMMPPDSEDDNPLSTIYHEYVHLLTNDNTFQLPLWFKEGLAEFYSSFKLMDGGKKIVIGQALAEHLVRLREEKHLPLARLFAVDHDDPDYNEQSKISVFYSQSWALVHYLMMRDNIQKRPQLSKFLELLINSKSTEEAFKEAFQTEYSVIEKELRKYIDQNSYTQTVYTLKKKLEVESTIVSRSVSEAEWTYYLGDLAMHMRKASGEELLNKAISLDPNMAGPHTSLGMLYFRTGRIDNAKKSLERARNLGSDQYLVYFYSAYLLSREASGELGIIRGYSDETATTIREYLKKAIELNPTYPESYSLFALVSMVTGENLDEAETMLKKALRLSAGRSDFQFSLAQIYMRQNKYDEAGKIASHLVKNSDNSQVRENAKHLLSAIERMNEYAESSKRRIIDTSNKIEDEEKSDQELTATRNKPKPTLPLKPNDASLEGNKATGLLTEIQCRHDGVSFIIKNENNATQKFHTKKPESVKFVSFTPEARQSSEIKCGKLETPAKVTVTHKSTGEPTQITFVKQ